MSAIRCRVASCNFVTGCLMSDVTGNPRWGHGLASGADLVDEPLDGLLPPDPDSLLKGMQLSLAVPTRVSDLELDE